MLLQLALTVHFFSFSVRGKKSCGLDEVRKPECQIKPGLKSKSCALTRAQEPFFFGEKFCVFNKKWVDSPVKGGQQVSRKSVTQL